MPPAAIPGKFRPILGLLGAIVFAAQPPRALAADPAAAQRNAPSEEALGEKEPDNPAVSILAGLNVADFYLDESGLPESSPDWNYLQAGLQTIWRTGPYVALQANFLFTRKGVVRDYGDHETSTSLDYAEIPLLLRIRLGNWPAALQVHGLAGGYGGFLLASQTRVTWRTLEGVSPAEGYRDWDYGAALGLAYQWGSLSLEGLYTLGLADLREAAPSGRMRMGAFSLMLGINFYPPEPGVWQ